MKAQTVRQISTSKVPSRQVHEAFIHSKKQAKHVDDPHAHGMIAGMGASRVDIKNPSFHIHELAQSTAFATIVRSGDERLMPAFIHTYRQFSAPRSQYDVLKDAWIEKFLSVSQKTSHYNA